MKLSSMKYLTLQGMRNIWTNRMMAFASFCILMVSLLLVGTSILFSVNVNKIVGGIENRNEVIIFLEENTGDTEIEGLGKVLSGMPNISRVSFYSKEEALTDYRDTINPEYQALFEYLDENPLLDSYKIRIKDIEIISQTVAEIESLNNVYIVKAPNDFATLLTEVKKIITLISTTIIIALIIVSMVIISNTTKASVAFRKKEIGIMKYVGATDAFIKIPFFIEGMFTGIMAGLAATFITGLAYDALIQSLSEEMTVWSVIGAQSFYAFNDISKIILIAYIIAGGIIGAIGTVWSTRRSLRV